MVTGSRERLGNSAPEIVVGRGERAGMTGAQMPYVAGDFGSGRPVLSVVPDGLADAGLSVEELGSRIVGLAGRVAAAGNPLKP